MNTMKAIKTKQERINDKIKLAKRLGLEVYELYVDSAQREITCVEIPHTSNKLYAELARSVNYNGLKSIGLKHIIFDDGQAYMPVSLLKPDRYCSGIAWRENEAIHTILESYHLDEGEYYKAEMELISEAMPDLMDDLWDDVTKAHPEKAADLLAQYDSRSDLIEDMVSHCSDIFEMAGEYPFLDGGQYPYLSSNPKLTSAVISVIDSL